MPAIVLRRFDLYSRAALELQHFEELPLGAEWTTRRRTVTEADLVNFSQLAGDFNPLHVDAEYARTTEFGVPIAPSAFLAAAAIGLGSMDVPIPATVGMFGMTWRFLRPVKVGDTVHARWRLMRKRAVENPKWGLATWRVQVIDQRGEVGAEGEVTRLVARAEPQKPAPSGRRRRRRRAGGATATAVATTVAEQGVPESTPADTPPPARRRRRRRPSNGSGGNGGGGRSRESGETATEVAQTPVASPAIASQHLESGRPFASRRRST